MVSQDQHALQGAPAAPGTPGALGTELRDVFRILAERRNIILGAGALGLVLGIIASLLMTPMYRASALLELNSSSEFMESVSGAVLTPKQAARANAEMIGTQIGLLQSESLARRVAQDLNLVSNPEFGGEGGTREQRTKRAVALLRQNTEVNAIKNSMLVQVSFSWPDPQFAARVTNALAQGFIASNLERRYDSSSYARRFLSDQLARTKAALEESERNLNTYAIQSGVFRAPGQVVDGKSQEGATIGVLDLTALNEALNEARVKRIMAEQAWRNADLESSAAQGQNIGDLVRQKATLQAQYDEQARVFKPDYPAMQQLRASIARIDSAIAEERGRASSTKRAELLAAYRSAQRTEAQLAERVGNAKGDVLTERSRSIQYNILQREADTNRALYDALLQRYKEIGVAGGIGQSNVSLVDPAEPPGGPFRPNLPLNAAIGLIAGLAIGVGLAFVVHLLFDNIVEPADVRRKLHLPVLGVVPFVEDGMTPMEALADRKSDVSEAYYSLRTALTFSRPEGPPSSLLVTSTRPGEGKSVTSYAVARNMARAGKRVLLIDADLRKPTFVSSRDDGYGLAHLLGTDEPLAGYVETTQEDNLSLLPVGRFIGSAAELLSSTRLPIILAEAKSRYDMVVVDGPPVLGLTDAPLLGSVVEGTVFVIESRVSRTANVAEMIRRLTEAGTEILGVVLTKVSQGTSTYGYSYYSYTYGTQGAGGKVSSDPARKLDLTTLDS
jgi:polysaccharide biosynthesis transport protein